jgi:hypothetical protein
VLGGDSPKLHPRFEETYRQLLDCARVYSHSLYAQSSLMLTQVRRTPMQVAIIGATGMLGHHAAEAVVAAGHELTVVHRASTVA